LKRLKTSLTGDDELKGKEETVVLCDLSPLQAELYAEALALPDFDNARFHNTLCPCRKGEYERMLQRQQQQKRGGGASSSTGTGAAAMIVGGEVVKERERGEADDSWRNSTAAHSRKKIPKEWKRRNCCLEYQVPLLRDGGKESGEIDPRFVRPRLNLFAMVVDYSI
jgi:hypothetical protein